MIEQLFAQRGQDAYYGEPVSQLEHALQCAQLAETANADKEVILAALLHDIGHLLPSDDAADHMDDYGRVDHEQLGADFLRELGFSEKMAQLIENHVNAKRFLVATNKAYAAKLSEASVQTLLMQGGPMTAQESSRFLLHPYFKEIIQVRLWDEQAKIPGLPTPDLAYFLSRYSTPDSL
ncbi:HD domain-containing protein [Fibrella arboris]|uniref:HD domain-containing protein n=1 Tax=Fibrella arboris TaxID=3242486 RepID=UPI0035200F21